MLLHCRKFLHPFLMYMYMMVESVIEVHIIESQQAAGRKLHMQDAVVNDASINSNDVGKIFILPSSFINSWQYLHKYTQDVFTYVLNYRLPDLYITFTCNPSWTEITGKEQPVDMTSQPTFSN